MNVMKHVSVAVFICAAALAETAHGQSHVDPDLGARLFSASYTVTFRGIRAGELVFTLKKSGTHFVYESIAHPRALARIVVNDNLREASEFAIEQGVIKPLSYELDDGSKKTDEDTRLTFDWQGQKAVGMHEDQHIEIPLAPGVQDRMSAQVEVMRWLQAGREPSAITFIDRNELKEYRYVHVRDETIKTAIGDLAATVIESSRPGSNRLTRLWYATALEYLPVRGEQVRKGKVETVFEIKELKQ